MRDVLDKILLIEAIETREPDFRFLMLEDNHIFIIENDEAIKAVVDSIRKLGTETDEGRQIARRIFGKEPEEIEDSEIFDKIIVPGYKDVRPFRGEIDRQLKQYDLDAISSLADKPFMKGAIADTIPKGKYDTPLGQVDVDVSGGDLGAVQDVYKKLGKAFPKAKQQLKTGDVMGALNQVYSRMKDGQSQEYRPSPKTPRFNPNRRYPTPRGIQPEMFHPDFANPPQNPYKGYQPRVDDPPPLDQENKGYIPDPYGDGQGNLRPDGSTRPGYKRPMPIRPKPKGYDI